MDIITPLLQAQSVSKIYSGASVAVGLHRLSAKFWRGEFVAVTGSSGSGKSTLLNILSGLDTYDEGELLFEGEPTSHYTEEDRSEYRRQHVAFIFQDYNLIDSYTVYQNVELALLTSHPDPKDRHERIMRLLDEVGLASHAKQRAIKLSGGQKQRVSIARALAKDAPILFADEPCGNLDTGTTQEIMALLARLSQDKLVIMVTHSFDEVAQYATRKLRLADGELVEDQVIKEVALEPSDTPVPAITRKQTFGQIVRVAWYNLKATPKRSMFGILGLVALTVLFMWLATMGINNLQASEFHNGYYRYDLQVYHPDHSAVSDEEIAAIRAIDGVKGVYRNNSLLSSIIYYDLREEGMSGYLRTAETFDGLLYDGRLPENDTEVVINLPADRQYTTRNYLGSEVELYVISDPNEPFKLLPMTIVGVTANNDYIFYVHSSFIDKYAVNYYNGSEANQLTVVTDPASLDTVRKTIRSDSRYMVMHLYGDKLDTGLTTVIAWGELMLFAWATIILYRIITGSYRSLEQVKRRDYNVMRTVGLKSSFVKATYIGEMTLQGLVGWAIGLVLALASMVLYGVLSTTSFSYGFRFLAYWGRPLSWLTWVGFAIVMLSTISNAYRFNRYFYRQSVKQSQNKEVKPS